MRLYYKINLIKGLFGKFVKLNVHFVEDYADIYIDVVATLF